MQLERFRFNGVESTAMHLEIVSINGPEPLPFMPDRDISEEKVWKRDIPFFYGIEKSKCLEYDITFSMEFGYSFTREVRLKLAKWLFTTTYKPLQFYDDLDTYYYAVCVNAPELQLFNNNEGYFTAKFRCNAPHGFTRVYEYTYDLTANLTTTEIIIDNLSNVNDYYYPSIEFKLADIDTGISIVNTNDENREFGFAGLSTLETISVDNNNKLILSDMPATYRFDKFNGNWLRLVQGVNKLVVTGKSTLKVKMQFPIIK